MSDDRILTLNDDNFDEHVARLQVPILVDFWASWCTPCQAIVPALEELADELQGRVRIAEVNVDENGGLTNRFGIRSIPTLVVLKEGKVVDQIVGAAPKGEIRRVLSRHL